LAVNALNTFNPFSGPGKEAVATGTAAALAYLARRERDMAGSQRYHAANGKAATSIYDLNAAATFGKTGAGQRHRAVRLLGGGVPL